MASSSSSTDAVAGYIQRLNTLGQVEDITTNAFTHNIDEIKHANKINNIDDEPWSKNDFVTMENELSDDNGNRVSSMPTTTLAVRTSDLKSPFFDPDTGELVNAMVVQGNVPFSAYLDQALTDLDADILTALTKQLNFGLDSAAGVMKNCIAAHNVIHSLIVSVLMYFREKIVENRSSLADNEEGKVMAICRIADTLSEISSLIQEAKRVSYKLADDGGVSTTVVGERYIDPIRAKQPAKCNFCSVAGHGPTPIVGHFLDRLQKEYIKRNVDIVKEKRSAVQKGGLTDIFITRSSGVPQAIASKAASAAIQHNYAANTSERTTIECAFKRAKFDSQVSHLMRRYTDSKTRQFEYQYGLQEQQESPGRTEKIDERKSEHEEEVTTKSRAVSPKEKENEGFLTPERENASVRMYLPDENEEKQPNVQQIFAKSSQFLTPNLTMQRFQDQLAPPQLETTVETTLSSGSTEPIRPLPPHSFTGSLSPPLSPIHSPEPQVQQTSVAESGATLLSYYADRYSHYAKRYSYYADAYKQASAAESGDALLSYYADRYSHYSKRYSYYADAYAELILQSRPSSLPHISPIHSPEPQRRGPVVETGPISHPSYDEQVKPSLLSPIHSPPIGSVLEPSQSETDRIASEIRGLERLGFSPSLPAIRGRDRQNKASMEKEFDSRSRYIRSRSTRKKTH